MKEEEEDSLEEEDEEREAKSEREEVEVRPAIAPYLLEPCGRRGPARYGLGRGNRR